MSNLHARLLPPLLDAFCDGQTLLNACREMEAKLETAIKQVQQLQQSTRDRQQQQEATAQHSLQAASKDAAQLRGKVEELKVRHPRSPCHMCTCPYASHASRRCHARMHCLYHQLCTGIPQATAAVCDMATRRQLWAAGSRR